MAIIARPEVEEMLMELDVGKAVFAAGLRMQAATLRRVASASEDNAESLEVMARAIESGEMEIPAPGRPLRLVEGDPPEPEEGGPRMGYLQHAALDDTVSAAMVDFIARFEPTLVGPTPGIMRWAFVQAVNEAHEDGRMINEDTAIWIRDRVRELEEAEVDG